MPQHRCNAACNGMVSAGIFIVRKKGQRANFKSQRRNGQSPFHVQDVVFQAKLPSSTRGCDNNLSQHSSQWCSICQVTRRGRASSFKLPNCNSTLLIAIFFAGLPREREWKKKEDISSAVKRCGHACGCFTAGGANDLELSLHREPFPLHSGQSWPVTNEQRQLGELKMQVLFGRQ